jgi:hypothetical protein
VVDDPTSVLVGDKAETRVKTLVCHSASLSTEVHQLYRFLYLGRF